VSAFASLGFTYSSLLYLKGGVYIAVGSPIDGPSDVVKITYCTDIMALQATETLFLDFLALPVGIFRPA